MASVIKNVIQVDEAQVRAHAALLSCEWLPATPASLLRL